MYYIYYIYCIYCIHMLYIYIYYIVYIVYTIYICMYTYMYTFTRKISSCRFMYPVTSSGMPAGV